MFTTTDPQRGRPRLRRDVASRLLIHDTTNQGAPRKNGRSSRWPSVARSRKSPSSSARMPTPGCSRKSGTGSSVALTLGMAFRRCRPGRVRKSTFFLFVSSRGPSQSRGSYSCFPFFLYCCSGRFGYRAGVADGRLRHIREPYSWVRGRMRRVYSHCGRTHPSAEKRSIRCHILYALL